MSRIPRKLDVEPRFALSPAERHLLDCVDGALGTDDLVFMCGKPSADVDAILARLVEAGVVTFEAEPPKPVPAARPSYGDEIDLPPDFRAEIDALHARLEGHDYYALLGVTRTATKDDIRTAYYRVGPRFHPDKHFRKRLGPYKQRIEAIFAELTKAHDTLRFAERRAAYDANLGGGRAARVSSVGHSPSVFPPPPAKASAPAAPSVPLVETEEMRAARKALLAKKLAAATSGSAVPAPTPPAPPVTIPSTTTRAVVPPAATTVAPSSQAEVIRERFDRVATDMKEKRLKRYLQSAEDAMNLGDYRTAAAAYEQASKLDPEDGDLQKRAEQAKKLAGTA